MKLNLAKYSFGVTSGKFLGYLVTKRGIEADPNQIKVVENLQPPRSVKEVQKLTGRLAALNRFVSKYSEKSQSIFKTMNKGKIFEWSEECQASFEELKKYMSLPPLLAKPKQGERLLLYLAVSPYAMSAVLVRECGGRQHPIYYASKALLNAETTYTHLEKLALALVMASRKLRPYFQTHPIVVVKTFRLRIILSKPNISGRLVKWEVELGEYDLEYQPRTAIKSQVLADFIADFMFELYLEAEHELFTIRNPNTGIWTLKVDGSSNFRGSEVGIMLIFPERIVVERTVRCDFKITNNEAEYEALIADLSLEKDLRAKGLCVKSDSQLIVNQVGGDFQTRDSRMIAYLELVKELLLNFDQVEVEYVSREENSHADAMANLASSVDAFSARAIPFVVAQWPAVWRGESLGANKVHPISEEENWMTPIVKYLVENEWPTDQTEARRLVSKAVKFAMISGVLYRRSFSGPYLKCVSPSEAQCILSKLHEGECGNHSGHMSLAN